jgi:hypothetical protein
VWLLNKRKALQEQVDRDYPELAELAQLLDSKWGVLGFRFGIDAIAGLLPVVGDAATGLISAYIVYKAARLGAPRDVLGRMAANVVIDVAVGAIPVAGTVFDVFFKANNRNIKLLRAHLKAEGEKLPMPLLGQEIDPLAPRRVVKSR